ncbi:hypothetical protein M0802_013604 [Mischocyttarus mexicanus]|nr:hypothetical protein M0802_013604 [Mischocyttarus mexicanus]
MNEIANLETRLCTQFLESLDINGPLITRVFVANLDYKVDEKKLWEVFKLAEKFYMLNWAKIRTGNLAILEL